MPDALVTLRTVSLTHGVQPLFEDLDLVVHQGERLAVIGANGTGKSTLLGLLSGRTAPDSGERAVQRNSVIAHVPQDETWPDDHTPRLVLAEAMAAAGAGNASDLIHDHRVAAMLTRLEWDDPERPAMAHSGGWRKRLTIAARLIIEPDLLLLDEPTNHLDLAGLLWLQALISGLSCAVVLVSHDRWFLDEVASACLEIGPQFPGGIYRAPGSYRAFLEQRDDFLAQQRDQADRLANKLRREEAWLARRPKARTTKSVSRIKDAEQLRGDHAELARRNRVSGDIGIDFQASGRRTSDLVIAEGLAVERGGNRLISGLDLTLGPGQRLGIIGGNGSGKTSLLKVISGELQPAGGRLRHAPELRIATFSQDRSNLDLKASIRQHFCPSGGDRVAFRDGHQHVNAWAQRFRFAPHQLDQTVGSLSGGEQARLVIALLMQEPADLLMLDEPTNDLDIPALEVLEGNLETFPGALVLITHDRWLLDRVSTDLLALDGNGRAQHAASYAQWEASQVHGTANSSPGSADPSSDGPTGADSQATAPSTSNAGNGGLTYAEQKELRGMEAKIEKAETKLAAIDEQLVDPANATDATALTRLGGERDQAQATVDDLYARWETLEAKRG